MRLRILMVNHTPWTRELGAPRVQLELGEELVALGDHVEKFSYEDAFPPTPPSPPRSPGRLLDFLRTNRSFAARARKYVLAHGHRFDVIDANQTDLPFPKWDLGFSGLLVARSVGLIPTYAEFDRWARQRWPEPYSSRRLIHHALTFPAQRRRLRDVEPSFRCADLVNVSNQDDLATVAQHLGCGDKVVAFPFGLSDARREAFWQARADASERLAARTVVFIGAWSNRKGSEDWPHIVRRVRGLISNVRFRFLGTVFDRQHVLQGFAAADREAVEVIPRYRSEELPQLLAPVTVGAFPGYLEGFGFSLLEKIAAGLPTVAYDAPGSRETLRQLRRPLAVPAGDIEAFALQLAEVLSLPLESWLKLSNDALEGASRLSWREIAKATRDVYIQRLEEIRGSRPRVS